MSHSLRVLLMLLATLAVLPSAQADEHAPFAQPRAGLYTGGQPDAQQLEALATEGLRTVIDLRKPDETRGYDEVALAARLGLHYVAPPIADAAALTPANAAALKRALAAGEGPVLLHCASGNRVGALLALMAADQEGMPPQAALDLGKRAGLKSLEPVVRKQLGLEAAAMPAPERAH
ncbi:beta-lactamase hydrolase domain-containing protein [Dokdonella soli]|uniref:Sulfur transferase domain-containing protein n=1 Tax=Dokdonella soli TaxID=529810 RepID=A0ABN1IMX1_9GAMM